MLPGNTYHLFNHANGYENLFTESKNYDFFLERLSLHVLPVAHIYAYCLMPNHFHLLVKIRSEKELLDHFEQKGKSRPWEVENDTKIIEPITGSDQLFLVKKVSNLFPTCLIVIPRHLIKCMTGWVAYLCKI